MRWILVEARDRVMPEIPASLAAFATAELRGRGIDIRTSTTLDEVTADSARLSDGEVVAAHTVVWTAGVRPTPVIADLGLPLDDTGRIRAERTLRVEGYQDVWAIGDGASVPDPARKGQPSPPTAQHAIRQGRLAGRNVAAAIGGGAGATVKPFTYRTKGVFVDMGDGEAVASTMGLRWRGRPAWLLARTYHLAMMPGFKRKLRLLVDWNIQLLFGRDGSELGKLGHPPSLAEVQRRGRGEGSGGGNGSGRAADVAPPPRN
jgi:NADH dehydrogenase